MKKTSGIVARTPGRKRRRAAVAPCGRKHANMYFSRQVATPLKTLLFCDARATFIMHIPNMFAQHPMQTTPAADSLYFALYVSPIPFTLSFDCVCKWDKR